MSYVLGKEYQFFSPSQEQDANRDGFPMWDSWLEQRFILELKVHVQGKFGFTHGLEDLILDFILHEDKGRTAMSWASRCTVRRNGRHGQHFFCW